jgi:hypothetical protein
LDRSIEIIELHKTPQDKEIHKKWLRDRKQDDWCLQHKIKFVRIFDNQLETELIIQKIEAILA